MSFTTKNNLNYCTAVRSYWACNWIYEPLTDSETWLFFSSLSSFFSLFLYLFSLLFSTSFFRVIGWSCDIIGSLKFSLSFLFNVLKKLFSEILIIVIENGIIEFKKSLVFDFECSGFWLIELNGSEIHVFKWENGVSSKDRININIDRDWSMSFHGFSFEYFHEDISGVTVGFEFDFF